MVTQDFHAATPLDAVLLPYVHLFYLHRLRYDVPRSQLLPEQNNTVWISYPAAVFIRFLQTHLQVPVRSDNDRSVLPAVLKDPNPFFPVSFWILFLVPVPPVLPYQDH